MEEVAGISPRHIFLKIKYEVQALGEKKQNYYYLKIYYWLYENP